MKIVLAAAMMLACGGAHKQWDDMTRSERVAALNEIADACSLPRSSLKPVRGGELRFSPPPSATFESVDCALGKLKTLGAIQRTGFVGNRAATNEKP